MCNLSDLVVKVLVQVLGSEDARCYRPRPHTKVLEALNELQVFLQE